MAVGFIKSIRADKGYGFIVGADGDWFFHIRDSTFSDDDFNDSLRELEVEYTESTDPRSGKPRAVDVRPAR